MNERIRLINSQLTALRAEYSRLTDWVKCGLPAELADTVFTHVLTVQENEFVKTKARHLQKFECFLDSTKRQEESVFGKRNVFFLIISIISQIFIRKTFKIRVP